MNSKSLIYYRIVSNQSISSYFVNNEQNMLQTMFMPGLIMFKLVVRNVGQRDHFECLFFQLALRCVLVL